jgi:cobalt/nickel transport system permease protein
VRDHHHGHDVGEKLYLHRHSIVHELPAHIKILASLFFIVIVVATPITNWQMFAIYLILILTIIKAAQLPIKVVAQRSLIEIPFIFFALLMPFVGTGERFEFSIFNFYREGLVAAASIISKGTIGVLMAVNLSATTTARQLLAGFERLNMPQPMLQIMAFMLRYVNVVSDEMERMSIARAARGFEAKGVKDWRVLASVAGALFIRSYERGERVHLAMLSRGYQGELPKFDQEKYPVRYWVFAFTIPLLALLLLLLTSWME